NPRIVYVTIQEGRYHQVKRMFHAIENEVTKLKRVQIGSLKLDDNLSKGAYRTLTEAELELVKN
ncbi:16S rRNA pseudouridine(516) synthase, partial [Klebsiella pneumoniae]|nr:16S rRNA pseudouridine(516) synthase [Klebsiella pneumoniae]